jgi:hypothetical protein
MLLYEWCWVELRIPSILCTGRRLNGERLAERESNDLHSAATHRVSGQLVAGRAGISAVWTAMPLKRGKHGTDSISM